jgi:hypothetical protein
VNLAKEGTWDEPLKKKIENFGLASNKLQEKAELIETDYKYLVNLFLGSQENTLQTVLNNNATDPETNAKRNQIIKSLKKIELIGERSSDIISLVNKTEKDIEEFIDNKLSGVKKNKLKQGYRKRQSWLKKVMSTLSDTVNQFANILKMVILGLYYIARIFVFLVRYFILIPAALLERFFGSFKIKK